MRFVWCLFALGVVVSGAACGCSGEAAQEFCSRYYIARDTDKFGVLVLRLEKGRGPEGFVRLLCRD